MTEFLPPRVIRGPHSQTILSSIGLRRAVVRHRARGIRRAAGDEIVDCGEDVRLLVQHSPPATDADPKTIVLFHGWEGSSDSTYLLAATTMFWRAGFRVLRLNLRDHGPSHHLNKELFHSCRLDEAIGAVEWVRLRFPEDELYLGGFSLGGNFCLRISASDRAASLRIKKTFAICPVLDPVQTMHALDGGWVGYRQYFIRKWRRSLHRKQAAFPDTYDFADLENFNSLGDMTEYFVNHYTEYLDLMTYLRGYAITGKRLETLAVPSALLLASDDPVIPVDSAKQIAQSTNLHIDIQRWGGHCGFLTDYRLRSWLDNWLLRAVLT